LLIADAIFVIVKRVCCVFKQRFLVVSALRKSKGYPLVAKGWAASARRLIDIFSSIRCAPARC
jgi:hypothetical protein